MALPTLKSIGHHAGTNKQYREDLYQHMGYLITITGLDKLAQGTEEEGKYPGFHSIPLLKHFCSCHPEFHSKSNMTKMVTQPGLRLEHSDY